MTRNFLRIGYLCGFLLTVTMFSCSESPDGTPAPSAAKDAAGTPESRQTDSSEEVTADGATATPVEYFNSLTREQIADGWISQFDGQTLFGWVSGDQGINWHVADGAITADDGPIGLLHTTVPFANYELLCDFRYAPGGNSGLFLRTIPQPKDVKTDCYELNLADSHPDGFTSGSYVGVKKTDEPIVASGDWHTFHVTLEGGRSLVKLDGETILDFTDERADKPVSGFIGLQHNRGKVEFRNILLKPLGMTDLFNGTDLTGWRIVPGSKSEFDIEEGTIHASNGPGFLETEGTYGDFIFQAEAIVHGNELNSGYFFRAMPGTEDAPSNGYELQIHNGFTDGDRTKPNNAGTGALFRRNEARRVMSSDNEWFTSTLVASGPRMAVWVDGYQVTDLEDTREPHENPRKGKRLEAGHISLQCHDPTTDLSFRNLKIAELPQP